MAKSTRGSGIHEGSQTKLARPSPPWPPCAYGSLWLSVPRQPRVIGGPRWSPSVVDVHSVGPGRLGCPETTTGRGMAGLAWAQYSPEYPCRSEGVPLTRFPDLVGSATFDASGDSSRLRPPRNRCCDRPDHGVRLSRLGSPRHGQVSKHSPYNARRASRVQSFQRSDMKHS